MMIAIQPPSVALPLSPTIGAEPAAGASPSALAGKFDALMQNLRQAPSSSASTRDPSVVSNLVQVGNSGVQSVVDQMHRINESASTMSLQEFHAAGMALTMNAAMTMFQLNAGMGVVQSSKSAVQTLFKNQ